jgi:hypothetical protein
MSSKPAFQQTLDASAETLAALRASKASLATARKEAEEVSRICSIAGAGKDGLFRVMRQHMVFSVAAGRVGWTLSAPHEMVIPPAWLNKSGKQIASHFTDLLKVGAVAFGHRVEGAGQIMTKSRDRSVKDSVTTYTYLSAVLPAAEEASWFAAGILCETPLDAPPPASWVEEQRRKEVMLASGAAAAGGAAWEEEYICEARAEVPKKGKKTAAAAPAAPAATPAPASAAPAPASAAPAAPLGSWEDDC